MISLLAKSLVFVGILILVRALAIVRRLISRLPYGPLRRRWYAMAALIVVFFVGYLGYIAAFWGTHVTLLHLIVPGIFFFGAVFVWITAGLSLQTTIDIMRISLLERETLTDPLTGVFNRRYLEQRLVEEVSAAKRYGFPLAGLLIDIDHFKQVNDVHGHQVGDQALVAVANVLSGGLRESDILARYGGEEFVVIAPHTPPLRATELASRLHRAIGALEFSPTGDADGSIPIPLTVSVGVGNFGDGVDSMEQLVGLADENMYRAKNEGRNRVVG